MDGLGFLISMIMMTTMIKERGGARGGEGGMFCRRKGGWMDGCLYREALFYKHLDFS